MKPHKYFVIAALSLLVISTSFAQSNNMQKNKMMNDSSKSGMMMDDKMDKDGMMENNMMINFYNEDGVAIEGYDPVAYFDMGKPMKGSMKHSYNWMGVDWHFTSNEHMMMFKENPQKYAPQYGGHCAFAASKGYVASVDPEAWTIHDGKLYLNHNESVSMKFHENMEQKIMKADMNWKEGKLKDEM